MNKVILMGRLTKDPEVRYTSTNNTAVCTFTLAVDRRFTKQGEEKQTDFFPIVTWQKTAEFCGKYLQKGRQILVSGRLQNRNWDDAEGKKHYITEIVADEVHFADSKRGDSAPGTNMMNGMPGMTGTGFPGKKPEIEQDNGFYQSQGDDELPF
jgi:single-strand DNA-binding protein